MNKVKRLCRTSLICLVLAALCGNFAFPVVNAQAAPPMQAATNLVISEFRTRGPAGGNDEFVEIFNPTATPINIGGWLIRASSNTATIGTRYTFPNGTLLQSGRHFIITGTAYSGGIQETPVAALSATGIADDGGIAITLSDGTTIIDQVGMSLGSAYGEGTRLSPLTTNTDRSYDRNLEASGSCIDSNSNSPDFFERSPSDPQNSSSALTTCGNPTPTSTPTSTATSTPTSTPTGTATNTATPTATATSARSVIINEVAWGGTVANSGHEWFELYNNTGSDINLNGWRLIADDGNPNIALSGIITAADPYFVFAANASVFNDLVPDRIYSGQLSNTGEILSLLDPNGNQIDTANLDGGAWNAGSGSPTFASMERQGNVADSPTAWVTYGGTIPVAHDQGGNDIKGTPGQANWIQTITPTPTPTVTGTATSTGTVAVSPTILINEVAWSGTAANSSDEWIELYNPGSSPVDITGWQLYGDDNILNTVGNPNITLSGTIAAGGYFLLERDQLATDVGANQVYTGGDLLNTGERIYLKDKSGNTIDTANLDGSAWPAGTASVTTTSPPAYASMERVGKTGNQWITYGGTVAVAHNRTGGDIKGTPGRANWISAATVTTITSDTPDPSIVNQNVSVRVTVIGGTTTPTGSVVITGATTNCTMTLSSGTGVCVIRFSSVGTKTITATYNSTNGLPASNDTESHQVTTSGTVFFTPTPVPIPPPQLVAINEFVPRPGHDWNHDGVVNVGDEYIELLNHGTVDVNLSGYRLDDEVNIGSSPYSLPAKVLKPGERIVYFGSETGLLLGDGGDGVRLLKPNGQLMDAYNYSVVGYPDQAYCRLPDNGGADDWNQNCYPTPGLQNSLSGTPASSSGGVRDEALCPIADTLPFDFVLAECDPFGNNIWRPEFWDQTGWYDEKTLPDIDSKWPVFAD